MSDIRKILLEPEFVYYHNLLTAHCHNLIEYYKSNILSINYYDDTRILEFGSSSQTSEETLSFSDNGQGAVLLTLPSTASITDDGQGNVTITGVTFTDNEIGSVIIY